MNQDKLDPRVVRTRGMLRKSLVGLDLRQGIWQPFYPGDYRSRRLEPGYILPAL